MATSREYLKKFLDKKMDGDEAQNEFDDYVEAKVTELIKRDEEVCVDSLVDKYSGK